MKIYLFFVPLLIIIILWYMFRDKLPKPAKHVRFQLPDLKRVGDTWVIDDRP
jgi:hypothetical protein